MISDAKIKEIRQFIGDISGKSVYVHKRYTTPKEKWPEIWEQDLELALKLRIEGKFEDSINIYLNLIDTSGIAYLTIIYEMYKSLICSGNIVESTYLLIAAGRVQDNNNHPHPNILKSLNTSWVALPNDFMDFLKLHLESDDDEYGRNLIDYLCELSCNPEYIWPSSSLSYGNA